MGQGENPWPIIFLKGRALFASNTCHLLGRDARRMHDTLPLGIPLLSAIHRNTCEKDRQVAYAPQSLLYRASIENRFARQTIRKSIQFLSYASISSLGLNACDRVTRVKSLHAGKFEAAYYSFMDFPFSLACNSNQMRWRTLTAM